MSDRTQLPAEWRSMGVDAAKGAGVAAGATAAEIARAAVKHVAAHKGAALAAKGAALGAAKVSTLTVLAATPAAAFVLPVAAAVGAGWLARRLIARL